MLDDNIEVGHLTQCFFTLLQYYKVSWYRSWCFFCHLYFCYSFFLFIVVGLSFLPLSFKSSLNTLSIRHLNIHYFDCTENNTSFPLIYFFCLQSIYEFLCSSVSIVCIILSSVRGQVQPGQCSNGLEEQLPTQCFSANGVDYQGVLFVLSGNRTGAIPSGMDYNSFRSLMCQ